MYLIIWSPDGAPSTNIIHTSSQNVRYVDIAMSGGVTKTLHSASDAQRSFVTVPTLEINFQHLGELPKIYQMSITLGLVG